MAHWNDEDFLDFVYGLKAEDFHLVQCPECARKLAQYQARRRAILHQTTPDPSAEFLAAQRRSIYERMQNRDPGTANRLWRPALALVSLCAVGFVLLQPPEQAPARVPEEDEASYPAVYYETGGNSAEAELYSDIYRMVSDSGLRAADPIQELFEN